MEALGCHPSTDVRVETEARFRRGRLLRGALRSRFLISAELMGRLREQGIDEIRKVNFARLEVDSTSPLALPM